MLLQPLKVNKPAIATAFSRAANSYDQAANFQRLCGEKLLAKIGDYTGLTMLDAGCGTGYFSRRFRDAGCHVLALDLAAGMLEQSRATDSADQYLLADIEHIPLPDGSVDLCFSNLAIQWCSSLTGALREMHRVVRPGGRVVFSSLAQGSLTELAQAWQHVDGQSHINQFLSFEAIAHACQPFPHQLSLQQETEFYPDVIALMKTLKGIGATHLHQGREAGLTGRRRLTQLAEAYPHQEQGLPLSYQLVTGVLYRE
ncbi:malonyl-ACP O-methyltransferase BioC [Pragia fontium]|uniref:Malonyl-[acyl-carrier protein] O-methyltransferase n=1 Tax=Pragia fontium DSM 5563 = ATCC 49100 TaxID=1122977 RepID=A0AAJ4WAS5_9GAMM|nr:malonyl-ACP O-methyltransferase BioC [Pragia fontium]SFC87954.1 pimeloyl-CoA biosynthesis protein BioC [Pragia fontium DSM 5563 = ATCC 49100]VEJ56054.1 Malonyl-CoA O-methyltransferase BioC [Pragia fontium]